jgi:hypothetical protein
LLPNLLIIGSAKSGTTSLHSYLGLHPEIAMSEQKELHFFVRPNWRQKIAWYESCFRDPAPVRGESSPSYTMFPFLPSAAAPAYELVPDAKLIYLVRDPVERTIANYVELYFLTRENRRVDEALGDPENPANPYVCPSRYATQLDHFLKLFPREQVLVVNQVDLLHRRLETLHRVFDFLDVDPTFVSPALDRVHNTRDEKVRYSKPGLWMIKHGIGTTSRRPRQRSPLIRPLRRLLSRPIDETLPPATLERLINILEPEVKRLRQITGQPLDWVHFPSAPGDEARSDL